MAFLGGLVGKLIGLAVLIVILIVSIGVFAFATDYQLEATVKEKDCTPPEPTITIITKIGGITKEKESTQQQCHAVNAGNFVQYRLRSGATRIYTTEGGACIYDSSSPAFSCNV